MSPGHVRLGTVPKMLSLAGIGSICVMMRRQRRLTAKVSYVFEVDSLGLGIVVLCRVQSTEPRMSEASARRLTEPG
jgi:hypothetical protein